MSSQQRVVQTGALLPNKVPPLEPGSSNVFESAIQKSNVQTASQMALIGGKKKHYRGGTTSLSPAPTQSPVVPVVSAPSYAVNKDATNDINAQITGLAVSNQNNAAFDGTVNGNPGDTAIIAAQQQATYTGKGGSIKRRRTASKYNKLGKKGGSWPIWGCLSGGKKSRKSRRTRRRKTRKYFKRQRR
jgi:hypothetical protein